MDYNNIYSEELKELTFEEASRELKLTPKKDDLLFFIYEYAKDNKLGIYDYKDLLQVCQDIRESEFRMERYRMDKKLLDELTINISAKHSRQGKKLFW